MAKDEGVETVGYHPKTGARTFKLKPGEKLPSGYSDKPHEGQHPHEQEAVAVGTTDAPKPVEEGAPGSGQQGQAGGKGEG